jgi:hypothetical protein
MQNPICSIKIIHTKLQSIVTPNGFKRNRKLIFYISNEVSKISSCFSFRLHKKENPCKASVGSLRRKEEEETQNQKELEEK